MLWWGATEFPATCLRMSTTVAAQDVSSKRRRLRTPPWRLIQPIEVVLVALIHVAVVVEFSDHQARLFEGVNLFEPLACI